MDRDINHLALCGNLLENLLREESRIDIVRFWTYETHVRSLLWEIPDEKFAEEGEERQLVNLLQQICDYCRFQLGWMDNKFAIELRVAPGWRIFVGFWDSRICIGESIVPNMRPPKMKTDKYGYPDYIRFR